MEKASEDFGNPRYSSDAEVVRLRQLVLNLAERLANASEVLSMLAERKDRRNIRHGPKEEKAEPVQDVPER